MVVAMVVWYVLFLLLLSLLFLGCYCCSSSCFGHLCDSKNTYGIMCEILLCFVTYVSKKKSFANSQMRNIILLCHLCELKKNHLRANKCACHFFSYFAWVRKTNCGLTNVQDFFYSSHTWDEKTICRLASVQYHFFSSLLWVKKPCASSQMCNIILSSPMWIKKIICKSINVKHIFLYSITWAHKCAILFFFPQLCNKKIHMC